ncbi:TetR/AcrR family transcriptional regulator [Sphingopyxis lindanitolerans]|nr:TetR/AcrR family transcriptional regulator [Sphingopyxis lindanitolerans]CAD7341649.1 Nucleoid occlusion factor SlmA [Sphingobium sp. S8]CAD7341704.1 Nucleoid occlusion factor SlmA [Sphingobium sp. S6]
MTQIRAFPMSESPVIPLRERRRQETMNEILDLSIEVIRQQGVAGLNLTTVARLLGVQPTALYKYFPSLMAVYDALYRRAENDVLHEVENAVASAEPGMAAIRDAMLAVDRWATVNPEMAQLLIGRPIPGYIPAPDALDPSIRILGIFRQSLDQAVARRQLDAGAAGSRHVLMLAALLTGASTLRMLHAEEPPCQADMEGLIPDLVSMFFRAFPPQDAPVPATDL